MEHRLLVAVNIQENIRIWLAENQPLTDDEKEPCPFQFGPIYLGSKLPLCRIEEVQRSNMDDPAFSNFADRLSDFVNDHLLPDESAKVKYNSNDKVGRTFRRTQVCNDEHTICLQIMECRFMKIAYDSRVTWTDHTDYLRCSPSFYGHPRYDGVIVQCRDGTFLFGRLVMVFLCAVSSVQTEPVVLILQPMDIPAGQRTDSRKDIHLGLNRVISRERADCIFISASNLVRGALLTPSYDADNNFFAVDMVDGDMFLRLKEIFWMSY